MRNLHVVTFESRSNFTELLPERDRTFHVAILLLGVASFFKLAFVCTSFSNLFCPRDEIFFIISALDILCY